MRRLSTFLSAFLFAFLFLPGTLSGQMTRITASGFAGGFFPGNDLSVGEMPFIEVSQDVSYTIGGRVAIWPSDRVGIEVEGAFVGSDFQFRTTEADDLVEVSTSGEVFLGSVNLVYAFIRAPLEPIVMYVSGGGGVISRSNELFDEVFVVDGQSIEFGGQTDVAGVIGLGIRYGVGRGVNIRADLKDYISAFELEANEQGLGDTEIQNDLLITAAVELSFGG